MAAAPDSAQIEAFRGFNRFYTSQIGVLEEGLLKTPYTLTQARILFELGTQSDVTASDINAVLGLDAGYLSRILQGFTASGLITRRKADDDGRRVLLSLTPKGRRAFQSLDKRSRDASSVLLAQLPESRRGRLLAALHNVQCILADRAREKEHDIVIRTHRPGDIGWAIERHGEIYAEEYGWNEEFEALVATLFARFANRHDPSKERLWIAELDGERVGCVFLVRNEEDPSMAQLRCLLVDPAARGHGIGKHLVSECIDFAKTVGYRRMMLWTNDVLISARRIYEAAGFTLGKEEHHHSFGHDLVGQFWVLDLT